MGIDWEEILGDENSEHFEDLWTGSEPDSGCYSDDYYDDDYYDDGFFDEGEDDVI